MTEHKFTDNEIVKALMCCAVDPNSGKYSDCKNCPLGTVQDARCFEFIIQQNALDLINRQKAEVAYWMDAAANAKREAVKEFAERLKERLIEGGIYPVLVKNSINDLVKEMTEA